MANSKIESGEYSRCILAETCKMNNFEKYSINPIYFYNKANRYDCHGLRDRIAEGKHIFFSVCWDIEQLNKAMETEEEINKLRKKYGTKA